jgi:hypothetical protein
MKRKKKKGKNEARHSLESQSQPPNQPHHNNPQPTSQPRAHRPEPSRLSSSSTRGGSRRSSRLGVHRARGGSRRGDAVRAKVADLRLGEDELRGARRDGHVGSAVSVGSPGGAGEEIDDLGGLREGSVGGDGDGAGLAVRASVGKDGEEGRLGDDDLVIGREGDGRLYKRTILK